MSEEVSSTITEAVKTASDGTVKIAVERYNELLETIAEQKGSIQGLDERLTKALAQPPIINRTIVNKTAEMLAEEQRVWGGTFIALGSSLAVVGAFLYRVGKKA